LISKARFCVLVGTSFVPVMIRWMRTTVVQWLRRSATNRKVAGSIPAGVIGIFHWHKILPITLWPWDRLSLQQKWVPGAFPGGKGGRCVRLTTLPPSCTVVMKSGNLDFLEPSGPLQACNGTALPLMIRWIQRPISHLCSIKYRWRISNLTLEARCIRRNVKWKFTSCIQEENFPVRRTVCPKIWFIHSASKDWMIVNNEVERIWNKEVVGWLSPLNTWNNSAFHSKDLFVSEEERGFQWKAKCLMVYRKQMSIECKNYGTHKSTPRGRKWWVSGS